MLRAGLHCITVVFVDFLRYHLGVISKGYKVDITDEKMLQDNVHKVLRSYGKIDGLVNNAANNPQVNEYDGVNFSRLENFPIDIWNKDLAVGLTGAFLCAKYYGYEISRNPNGGSIVNISSDLGIIAPDQRLYSDSSLKEEEKKVKPENFVLNKFDKSEREVIEEFKKLANKYFEHLILKEFSLFKTRISAG